MNISPTTLPPLAPSLSLQPAIGDMSFKAIFDDRATVPSPVEDMSPCHPVTVQGASALNTKNGPVQAGTRVNSIQPKASRIHHQDLKNIERSTPDLPTFIDALVSVAAASGESTETERLADASPSLDNVEPAANLPTCLIAIAAPTPEVYNPKVERQTVLIAKISESAIVPITLPQSARTARLPNSAREVTPETFSSTAMEAEAITIDIASSFQSSTPTAVASAAAEVVRRPEPSTLDLLKDAQWLGTLARDITTSAASDGKLQFRLVPEFLGALDVGLVHDGGSVDVHVETTTDAAARIIAAEQPRLLEELRHAGLKLGTFDLNGGQQGGTQREQQPTPRAALPNLTKDQTPPKRDGRFA